MEKVSRRILSLIALGSSLIIVLFTIVSCAVSEKVSQKSGAKLWEQNCQRCHNIPSADSYSGEQWETIGMHMQTRALITEMEREKIVEFLQQTPQ